jgi:hypothetical protein
MPRSSGSCAIPDFPERIARAFLAMRGMDWIECCAVGEEGLFCPDDMATCERAQICPRNGWAEREGLA